MRVAFTQKIILPGEWDRSDQTEPNLPLDGALEGRVLAAAQALSDVTFKENIPLAHKHLTQLGLVPLCDGDGDVPSRSLQVYFAKTITRLLSLGGVRFRLERDELDIKVPRSEILFLVAAIHFEVQICVFSARRRPHVYRPKTRPRCTIGLFWATDSFTSLSDILPLVCTKTKPTWRVPSENRMILYPKYPAASFRDGPRARACQAVQVDDGSAFIRPRVVRSLNHGKRSMPHEIWCQYI